MIARYRKNCGKVAAPVDSICWREYRATLPPSRSMIAGRSTITVSVLPEMEEVDVKINPADIEMAVMRSTGAGGQSVNTTDSAVRLTHKPSGIVVKCQQEKSQLKNRNMAMRMLASKLYDMEQEKIRNERDSARRGRFSSFGALLRLLR